MRRQEDVTHGNEKEREREREREREGGGGRREGERKKEREEHIMKSIQVTFSVVKNTLYKIFKTQNTSICGKSTWNTSIKYFSRGVFKIENTKNFFSKYLKYKILFGYIFKLNLLIMYVLDIKP